MRAALVVLALGACGGPFVPAYEGEPECGRASIIHALEGEPCPESISVACDCPERRTLECVDGRWIFKRLLCEPLSLGGGAP